MQPLPISVRRLWRIASLATGGVIFLGFGLALLLANSVGDANIATSLFLLPAGLGLVAGGFGVVAGWRPLEILGL